jgi:hypothetical protein
MKIGIGVATALAFALLCTPANAQGADQAAQQACGNDVFALCQAAIPDRGRIAACLRSHFRQVSRPCRTFMASYGGGHHRATTHHHRATKHHHRAKRHKLRRHRRSHDRQAHNF